MLQTSVGPRKQLLLQWEGLPLLESTWEDEDSFLSDHPNLEDKVVVKGGGNDMLLNGPR